MSDGVFLAVLITVGLVCYLVGVRAGLSVAHKLREKTQ